MKIEENNKPDLKQDKSNDQSQKDADIAIEKKELVSLGLNFEMLTCHLPILKSAIEMKL